MPRTSIREGSNLPSVLFASLGIALGIPLVHDDFDRRLLTADSIFHSPVTALLAALGVGMAVILLWDVLSSRRSR